MTKRGKPSLFINSEVVESEYQQSHPELLLEMMSQGMLDCQIYATLGIAETTFYRWRTEHDNFKKAFELGISKCQSWWLTEMKARFERGDDAGFKYCMAIMNNKFGWKDKGDVHASIHINQTTNTLNLNYEEKSAEDLRNILLEKLQENKIIDANIINESSEDK